ncbi:hypothetical protein HYU19_03690 [Candidatus Woesearchaeota archaeon]|nr:hypothetical protein [Candidatus Woesearchaeota archaeon]
MIPSSRPPQKVHTSELHPIDQKFTLGQKVILSQKKEFFGKSPTIFVGRYGYPSVNVGLLGVEEYYHHDDPLHWSREKYGIQPILDLRSTLVNSSFQASVKDFKNKFLELSQEIAMASRPADVEISLQKEPSFSLPDSVTTSAFHLPHGPRVGLKKARITENPHIPTKVDKVVSDIDLKAGSALQLLSSQFDEHYLTKLLSVGNLGVKTERKLVPTRWAITAVDDTLGKQLISKVKQRPEMPFTAFFGSHLGNYYLILFFPGVWSYELFETSIDPSKFGMYSTDHEEYGGRTSYAENTVGGYYAARLSVLEGLTSMKRQGTCLCLRFITSDYWAPLGVWVVREAARNAMQSAPIEFADKDLMLTYARHLVRRKFGYDLDVLLRESKLLTAMRVQKRLGSFFQQSP